MDNLLSKEQRITAAAEAIFAKHGFERATVDEIIALADVGKGTVYKYFGNKEQLFYQLVLKKNQLLVERLDAAVAHSQGYEQKMIAFFTEMIKFYKENAALWQIIYFEMLGSSNGCMVNTVNGVPVVISRYEAAPSDTEKEQLIRYHNILESEFCFLQQILQQATEDGSFKSGDPEVATKFLFFGVAMCLFHPHDAVEAMTPAEMAQITVDRFLNGIRA